MRQLGLFCGTFNPIHIGHLLMAECARDQFRLEQVLFVTSASPPHRATGLLDQEERHAMVVAAIHDNPCFQASRMELDRGGPSYTIDTIEALRQEYGEGTSISLLIGEDNLPYLKQWHRSEDIFRSCRLIVAPRDFPTPNPKYDSAEPVERDVPEATIEMLDFPLIAISASEIRERLRAGRSVRYMVAPAVYDILLGKGHFRERSQGQVER